MLAGGIFKKNLTKSYNSSKISIECIYGLINVYMWTRCVMTATLRVNTKLYATEDLWKIIFCVERYSIMFSLVHQSSFTWSNKFLSFQIFVFEELFSQNLISYSTKYLWQGNLIMTIIFVEWTFFPSHFRVVQWFVFSPRSKKDLKFLKSPANKIVFDGGNVH